MLNLQASRGLHHVERTDKITVEVRTRIFQRIANTCLPREVDNHIGREIIRDLCDQRIVLKHPFGHRKMWVLHQCLMPALLQRDVIVVGHAVKAVDAEPFVEQKLCEVKTDEAGGASDEDFSHGGVQYDKRICFAREAFGVDGYLNERFRLFR